MDRPSPHMPPPPAAPTTATSTRLGLAVLALALVWVAVYWLTPVPPESEEGVQIAFAEEAGDDEGLRGSSDETIASDPNVTPLETEAAPPDDDSATPENAVVPAAVDGVIPPEFKTYVVQSKDDPRSISQKVYGTPEHWRQVMRANPFVDFSRVRAGRTIRVPVDPENVQGIPVEEYEERTSQPPEPQFIEYIVEKNDTLTGIAKKIYGKSSFWTVIRDANLEKSGRDGSKIRPGMVLRIPPPPNKARS